MGPRCYPEENQLEHASARQLTRRQLFLAPEPANILPKETNPQGTTSDGAMLNSTSTGLIANTMTYAPISATQLEKITKAMNTKNTLAVVEVITKRNNALQ